MSVCLELIIKDFFLFPFLEIDIFKWSLKLDFMLVVKPLIKNSVILNVSDLNGLPVNISETFCYREKNLICSFYVRPQTADHSFN